jgi:hypothetical protein
MPGEVFLLNMLESMMILQAAAWAARRSAVGFCGFFATLSPGVWSFCTGARSGRTLKKYVYIEVLAKFAATALGPIKGFQGAKPLAAGGTYLGPPAAGG